MAGAFKIDETQINQDAIKFVKSFGGPSSCMPIGDKPLKYDKGFDASGSIPYDDLVDTADEYYEPGKEAKRAMGLGLPQFVQGNPLGCGCNIAYLHGAGEVIQGQIEADYMCDAGWHNFIVFQLRQKEPKVDSELKIDKFGNIMSEESVGVNEIEEY